MSERTSDAIRSEIERKRHEMDRTVDELEHRLTPAHMLDHALWMVRGADTGNSERARRVANRLAGFAKRHPIPTALLSAGTAWLFAESRRDEHVGPGTYAPAEGRVGPYMADALDPGPLRDEPGYAAPSGDGRGSSGHAVTERVREAASDVGERVHDATDRVVDRVQDATDRVVDRVHYASDSARDRLLDAREGVRERVLDAREAVSVRADVARERGSDLAYRAREQAALRGRQARDRYDRTLDENPLALGAAAFGLGLAAGLSAPSTHVESDLMGARADALKDEARTLAADTRRAVRAAGSEALRVARREALPESVVDEVKGRVRRVASDALDAAKQTARAEGLAVDQLRDRAKRIASE